MEKTYPTYFGTYNRIEELKVYTNSIKKKLIGCNGMHKYNNSDHSMLTEMTAVDNIKESINTKENICQINTEMEYHKKNKLSEQSVANQPCPCLF